MSRGIIVRDDDQISGIRIHRDNRIANLVIRILSRRRPRSICVITATTKTAAPAKTPRKLRPRLKHTKHQERQNYRAAHSECCLLVLDHFIPPTEAWALIVDY